MAINKTSYSSITSFVTKDGSYIKELMHPDKHGNKAQSLAEATIPPGGATALHRHKTSEEIYHITAGEGKMILGNQELMVSPGDTISIPAGTAHCVSNTSQQPLVILCACAPAYANADTELME